MKKFPAAILILSAASVFAEPVADFLIPYTSVKVDYDMIGDLEELKQLEKEHKKQQKIEEHKKERKPYTIPSPGKRDIGLSGIDHKRTQKFLDYYLSEEGMKHLCAILEKSEEYRIYIRAQLKKREMPMFLQYLPIVESEYNPRAVSVSGATGLWQFMENSMDPFLKKNEYYDQRLDPWIETDAALSKLEDNYKMFGSWELALAAYNMGAGALKRIKKESHADYWMLNDLELLSAQASSYVPKLCAITEVIENADYYGALPLGVASCTVEGKNPVPYGKINITGKITLSKISDRSGIDINTLRKLNPALLKECTPPGETWTIRVPHGKAKEVADSLRNSL